MHYIARILGVLTAAGLTVAAGFSILLAVADFDFRTNTPEGVERAVKLLPRNTAYLSLRALQVDYDGGDSRPLLERWAALDGYASGPRIRLGLDAEARGDQAAAEKWLLAAEQIDRQFEPRWTLANFYFRQGKAAEFWRWIRAALEVSYGDRGAAFDLCWRVSGDAGEIWSRAIPESREVVSRYLDYALRKGHPEAVAMAAVRLASWKNPEDAALLGWAMDVLLDSGDGAGAREVWEALGYAGPDGVVGADFDAPRIGHGFDWRFPAMAGVTHVGLDAPAAHRIVMSGQEPEGCELLRQFVMLTPGRRYRLRWESRTNGFPEATGLEWRLEGQRGAVRASPDWVQGELSLVGRAALATLALGYQRPAGEVRAEGRVDLRHVTLTESRE